MDASWSQKVLSNALVLSLGGAIAVLAGCGSEGILPSELNDPPAAVDMRQVNSDLRDLDELVAAGALPRSEFTDPTIWGDETLKLEFDEYYDEDGEPNLVDDATYTRLLKQQDQHRSLGDLRLRLDRLQNRLYRHLNNALSYAGTSARYLGRATRYGSRINQAWTVSQGLTDIQTGRNRLAERAHTNGYDRGVLDGMFFRDNPGEAFISMPYRSYWSRHGNAYAQSYDDGYASGVQWVFGANSTKW